MKFVPVEKIIIKSFLKQPVTVLCPIPRPTHKVFQLEAVSLMFLLRLKQIDQQQNIED